MHFKSVTHTTQKRIIKRKENFCDFHFHGLQFLQLSFIRSTLFRLAIYFIATHAFNSVMKLKLKLCVKARRRVVNHLRKIVDQTL